MVAYSSAVVENVIWTQRYPNVPDSQLSPSKTHVDGLLRWVSVPVYTDTNTLRLEPDGVLLKGDLVNGKTGPMER